MSHTEPMTGNAGDDVVTITMSAAHARIVTVILKRFAASNGEPFLPKSQDDADMFDLAKEMAGEAAEQVEKAVIEYNDQLRDFMGGM